MARELRYAITSALYSLLPAGLRLDRHSSKMRITAKILDGTYGQTAVGVRTSLARASGDGWATLAQAETSRDGSIEDWDNWRLESGLYRIVFDSDRYFAELGMATAYPEVAVIFRMENESAAFEVQVTLSPYSYSIYFGTLNGQLEKSG